MISSRRLRILPSLALPLAVALGFASAARADHTPDPTTVTLPGSFQSELGCPGDWMPDCLTSQLFDADLDGVFTYATGAIPPGSYEFKIALGLSWDLNYGEGGVLNGSTVGFEVPAGDVLVTFSWNSSTLVPSVVVDSTTPATSSSWERLKSMYR